MLIKSEPCPWCGQEIESPHLTRGTCEHCGKPYRPVILLYNRYRTRRSEVPLLQAYAFYIITFLMFLYIAVRNSLRRSGTLSFVAGLLAMLFYYKSHAWSDNRCLFPIQFQYPSAD